MRRAWIAVLVAVLLTAPGCGDDAPVSSDTGECAAPQLVATTTILGDVARDLMGEAGEVVVLMPVGADPHAFQASARQAALLREADLVVANGLGLEEGLHDVLAAAAGDGVVVIEAAAFVDVLPLDREEEDHGRGGHGDDDPHLWLDPRRMAEVVTGLGEALAAVDPACPDRWRVAAAASRERLLDLDAEIEQVLAAIPGEHRRLITAHHSLGYFADRYGFAVVAVIVPGGSTLAEPSPADLVDAVRALQAEAERAIFVDTTQLGALAEAVAAELGESVTIVDLYTGSLGQTGSGAETYPDMLRTNAARIAAALG